MRVLFIVALLGALIAFFPKTPTDHTQGDAHADRASHPVAAPPARGAPPQRAVPVPQSGLLIDPGGPIRRVLVQYVSSYTTQATIDIVTGLPDARSIVATVSSDDVTRLRASLPASALDRVTFVNGEPDLTLWARDAFLTVERHGRTRLIVRPERVGDEDRFGDRAMPEHIVGLGMMPRLELDLAEWYFEGGNVVADASRIYVGANIVDEQMVGEAAPYAADVSFGLYQQFGRPVRMVGDPTDPVPLDHLDMYLTPLGNETVLLGDPAWGARLLALAPAEVGVALREALAETEGHEVADAFIVSRWLRLNQREDVIEHFDRVARQLVASGLTVHRIPILTGGGETGLPVLTYNNVLQELRRNGRRVLVPSWGIAELDIVGHEVWSELGYDTIPVDVTSIIDLQGAVRCLTNVLERDPAPR